MFLLHPTVHPWIQRNAEHCLITLLCDRNDGLEVLLRGEPDNEELLITMEPGPRYHGLYSFCARLPWDQGNATTAYAFKILHDQRQTWLAADGCHAHVPPQAVHFRICRDQQPPLWIADQIIYQIFPDRFCQGNPELAVKTDEYQFGSGRQRVVKQAWGAPIDRSVSATAFYGGDLPGISQQLDYLQNELGITLLYLNPIFSAASNHRYDTLDYYQVDKHLGGNQALAELSQRLHARGMKLLLDAVVNHTGENHPWFDRSGGHSGDAPGAYQSPASPWRHWYVFQGPKAYTGWKGHGHLPVLDFANPEVRAVVYDNPNAILRYWMRPPYAIDGWRFDVMHMIGEGPGAWNNSYYAREFRRVLREENPQAYVLGEHFAEATRWLQGEQQDGAMNYYGFAHPLRAWLANQDIAYQPIAIDTPQFELWLTRARATIPYANQLAQMNLLDSHDTIRFLTLLGGNLARMRLAITLMFTYAGVPSVYYGDEIGLEGGSDPDCRRCFDWNRANWNMELFRHYQAMIQLRQEREEVRRGAYQTLAVSEDALLFARHTENSAILVAVNRGPTAVDLPCQLWQLPLATQAWQTLDGNTCLAMDSIHVPAEGYTILISR